MERILKNAILLLLMLLANLHAEGMEERTYKVINAVSGLADNSAQQVVCTHSGRMVISTLGNLNFYDGITFSHIGTRQDYQYQLPSYNGNYHLYFDNQHHIWLKDTHIVTLVDVFQEQFVENVDSVIKSMGCNEHVKDLFVDTKGSVWLLTSKGLYNVESKMTFDVLPGLNLQDVEVFDNLLLTFYENGEEVAQNMKSGKTEHRTQAYDSEFANRFNRSSVVLPYGDGFFQVRNGQNGGIMMWFDVRSKMWTTISEFTYHLNNMALFEDQIYIASEYGYWVYDIKTKDLQWVRELTMADGSKVETDCNVIAFDQQGGIWIGTESRGVL
jgi:ligand-binding sensor domain-containing protein